MAGAFENLEVWQLGKEVVEQIYGLTKTFPKEELYGLTSQIKRAALSIPSNIAEGTGRYHYKDRVKFYLASRGSLYELKSHLPIATEPGFVGEDGLQPMFDTIGKLGVKLNNLISATRRKAA